MSVVRLLPFADADGPHNMAADEMLLETAGAGQASLRFYGWSAPALSLGYFPAAHLSTFPIRFLPISLTFAGPPAARRWSTTTN